jgi:hypothetical protein
MIFSFVPDGGEKMNFPSVFAVSFNRIDLDWIGDKAVEELSEAMMILKL